MTNIGGYAAKQLRQAKHDRIKFALATKYLPVGLNLEGRYFAPLTGTSKITVRPNPPLKFEDNNFATQYNNSTDFYGFWTRASAEAATKGVEAISRDYGKTNVPTLRVGNLIVDPLHGHSNWHKSRLDIPIRIYGKANLRALVSLGGT